MPYPLLSQDAAFSLGDLQTSKRGQQFQVIHSLGLFQLTSIEQPLFCPFGANVYKGDGTETRLSLDVRIDETLAGTFRALDKKFKERIGPQKTQYHPLVHEDFEYGPRIRLDTAGPEATMLWAPDKTRLGTPKDVETRGASIVPVAAFTKAWYMGGMHGITLEMKHAIVLRTAGEDPDFDWPAPTENPF